MRSSSCWRANSALTPLSGSDASLAPPGKDLGHRLNRLRGIALVEGEVCVKRTDGVDAETQNGEHAPHTCDKAIQIRVAGAEVGGEQVGQPRSFDVPIARTP